MVSIGVELFAARLLKSVEFCGIWVLSQLQNHLQSRDEPNFSPVLNFGETQGCIIVTIWLPDPDDVSSILICMFPNACTRLRPKEPCGPQNNP